MKIVHLAPVLLVSFILAACGGGGGSSSDDMMTGPTTPDPMCPAGQTGTPPNCMDPPPPSPMFDGPNAHQVDRSLKYRCGCGQSGYDYRA